MSAPNAQARFGTFGGVFTPCVLTILGVIMFMRSGFVVGGVGLWQALLILGVSKSITLLTTMSLSAIATNTEIRTGGVYYMISRTLGPDFGGAIGITLFVSQAVSIAFYVIGFSEALFGLFPADAAATAAAWHLPQFVATGVIGLLFLVTFKGADAALRAQYAILGLLLLSVLSFVLGGIGGFSSDTLSANTGSSGVGFWAAFAIFFPAATGITAGANMSGDLKDPGKSIPNGTLAAIGFTAVIYTIQLVLVAGNTGSDSLVSDPFGSLQEMSVFGPLIIVGVFAATLSSALGSFLGAPRILQAMGQDGLIKPLVFFAKGHGPENEPRRATVLSLIIAVCVTWAGNLNAVAEVISMFFLIAYGMINLSAFVEGRGGNPSFRPRFKLFGWPAALTGAIGCAVAMVKIDETYAIISMVIAGGIYFYLRGQEAEWGDAKRGFIFSRTRENLLALEKSRPDPKNWRPVLAVITDDAERDRDVIHCGAWLEAERGLLSILEVAHHHDVSAATRVALRRDRLVQLRQLLTRNHIIGFADAVVLPPGSNSLDVVMQAYSIGSLRPNTALIGLPPPGDTDARAATVEAIESLAPFGLSTIIYKPASAPSALRRRIDIWWGGQRNGSLLALLAYLVSTSSEWSNVRMRMLRVVSTGAEHLDAERSLAELVAAARMKVDIEVILSQEPIPTLIAETSKGSDLVFLGMAERDIANFHTFLDQRAELLAALPATLLVASNGEADLLA